MVVEGKKKVVQVLETADVYPMKVGGKGGRKGSAHGQASPQSKTFLLSAS